MDKEKKIEAGNANRLVDRNYSLEVKEEKWTSMLIEQRFVSAYSHPRNGQIVFNGATRLLDKYPRVPKRSSIRRRQSKIITQPGQSGVIQVQG